MLSATPARLHFVLSTQPSTPRLSRQQVFGQLCCLCRRHRRRMTAVRAAVERFLLLPVATLLLLGGRGVQEARQARQDCECHCLASAIVRGSVAAYEGLKVCSQAGHSSWAKHNISKRDGTAWYDGTHLLLGDSRKAAVIATHVLRLLPSLLLLDSGRNARRPEGVDQVAAVKAPGRVVIVLAHLVNGNLHIAACALDRA